MHQVPKLAVVLCVAVAVGAGPATVAADESEEFTPPGYKWCGWKNLSDGSWTYGEPEDGAWLRLFATGMSCRDARRSLGRVHYGSKKPWPPKRQGYNCRRISEGHEYMDARCVKKGRSSVRFRWQTGA